MLEAAENLEFERAAELRDSIEALRAAILAEGKMKAAGQEPVRSKGIARRDPGA